jgi:DNA-binding MarR family transcriptional regulator
MKNLPLHSHILIKMSDVLMLAHCHIGDKIYRNNKEWRMFSVMDWVHRRTDEWPNQAHIGRILGLKPPACSRFIDSIVKQGYVKRVAGNDRRSHCIAFTSQGMKLWSKVSEEISQEMDKMLIGVPAGTVKKMAGALSVIDTNIRELRDGK